MPSNSDDGSSNPVSLIYQDDQAHGERGINHSPFRMPVTLRQSVTQAGSMHRNQQDTGSSRTLSGPMNALSPLSKLDVLPQHNDPQSFKRQRSPEETLVSERPLKSPRYNLMPPPPRPHVQRVDEGLRNEYEPVRDARNSRQAPHEASRTQTGQRLQSKNIRLFEDGTWESADATASKAHEHLWSGSLLQKTTFPSLAPPQTQDHYQPSSDQGEEHLPGHDWQSRSFSNADGKRNQHKKQDLTQHKNGTLLENDTIIVDDDGAPPSLRPNRNTADIYSHQLSRSGRSHQHDADDRQRHRVPLETYDHSQEPHDYEKDARESHILSPNQAAQQNMRTPSPRKRARQETLVNSDSVTSPFYQPTPSASNRSRLSIPKRHQNPLPTNATYMTQPSRANPYYGAELTGRTRLYGQDLTPAPRLEPRSTQPQHHQLPPQLFAPSTPRNVDGFLRRSDGPSMSIPSSPYFNRQQTLTPSLHAAQNPIGLRTNMFSSRRQIPAPMSSTPSVASNIRYSPSKATNKRLTAQDFQILEEEGAGRSSYASKPSKEWAKSVPNVRVGDLFEGQGYGNRGSVPPSFGMRRAARR